ncbi:MAG: GNAT family N-acetyltransferase [Alphaproteobacteria bacterium]|nr:GNAT family N-acetyltransferase [Alphaproteobacteria bacterium]
MNITIIHGTRGSPNINWFPWAREVFTQAGHTVHIPAMPTPENQTAQNWLEVYNTLPPADILIGHSIGATFLLHVLQHAKSPVKKSIFVAPVMGDIDFPEYDALNKSFWDFPFDWAHIKAMAGDITILHGDNDPYAPLTHPQKLRDLVEGDYSIIKDGEHLNGEAGFTEFPMLADIINLSIRPLKAEDTEIIAEAFSEQGWNKPASQYERYLEQQTSGKRTTLVALKDNVFAGYVTILWESHYAPFRENNIPEISDLNVLKKFQQQGVATQLIRAAEKMIARKSPTLGIGVGLLKDYGNAQKLYYRLGYVPDSNGATYNCEPIEHGARRPVDDDLVLWLRKAI